MTREERRQERRRNQRAAAVFTACLLICICLPEWADAVLMVVGL